MLPGHLLPLFTARAPLWRPPSDYSPEQRRTRHIAGVSQFLDALRAAEPLPAPTRTRLQDQLAERAAKRAAVAAKLREDTAQWNPKNDPLARGDPYCTLFVGRLRYSIDEADLEREFAKYGPIERIRVVRDQAEKSRGYAFIVFQQEHDAQRAKREAMGLLLKGQRILTDFERGRTQQSWKPRRLGGGRGGRNAARQPVEERRPRDQPARPRPIRDRPRDFRDRDPRDRDPRDRPHQPREPRQPRGPRWEPREREPRPYQRPQGGPAPGRVLRKY